jgi:hypothetical protein
MRDGITLVMREEDSISPVLDRIATRDDVDEQASLQGSVESSRHTRCNRRRLKARPNGYEKA